MSSQIRRLILVFSLVAIWFTTSARGQLPPPTASPSPAATAARPARQPFSKPDTPPRTDRIREVDFKHLKAELTIDPKKREVRGTVTHTLTPLHPYLTRFGLDCGPDLKVSEVSLGSPPVACESSTEGEKLWITLPKPADPGDELELAISYAGSPRTGLHFVIPDPAYPEQALAIWTQGQPEDNHHWLPCYDSPNDRLTSEMIVTVPRPLSVVSNGTQVSVRENSDGSRTFHWKQDQPHSTYLITLAISEFTRYQDRVDDLPVEYYVHRAIDEQTARRFLGKTPRMIRFLQERTGHPYPYPKYAQVCLPEFEGGMENTSATSMTDAALTDEIQALEANFDGLVAHELAHQWFGDLVTCKNWAHLWLNEGFASYFDPLYTQYDRGNDEFRLQMNGLLRNYLNNDQLYRRPIVEFRYDSPMRMFDGMSYAKGGCVLHMLRGLLGDEAWWKGINLYLSKHQFQVVETEDLRLAMEQAAGRQLKWFFDQWLSKAGHPELKVRWHYEAEDQTVRVRVEQTQTVDQQTPLFRLPTSLCLLDSPANSRTIPIVVDAATHEFVIPSDKRPQSVLIDPEGWLIKELDFEKPDEENLFLLEHADNVVHRLTAGRALLNRAETDPRIRQAISQAWRKEQSVSARVEWIKLLVGDSDTRSRTDGDAATAGPNLERAPEHFRPALMAAAVDSEARVRVAAIQGLGRLGRDPEAEAVLRAAWSDSKEAYGARIAALIGLVRWEVDDADKLLAATLANPVGKHLLAASALKLLLQRPGPRARELAAAYCRHGQPPRLRWAAINAFDRLAKDDPELQNLIIPLIDDPDRELRIRAWSLAESLHLTRALPALEARLKKERPGTTGFAGFGAPSSREALERAIRSLRGEGNSEPAAPSVAVPEKTPFQELEDQVRELEEKARALRKHLQLLRAGQKASKTPALSPR